MKIERKQIVELISISAVVLSVLFLAYELRQSNRIAIGNAELSAAMLNSDINTLIFGTDEAAELLTKLRDFDANLTPVELTRAGFYARNLITQWAAQRNLYERGLISERSFNNNVLARIESTLSTYPRLAQIYGYQLLENTPDDPSIVRRELERAVEKTLRQYE